MENKRIALVTGGNRGIGFEICRQLANAGFRVILTARDKQKGEEAAAKLQEEKLDVTFAQLEVGNETSTLQLADTIQKQYTHVDVLVNNAGILPNSAGIKNVGMREVKETFNTNFFGPLMLIQTLLPLLQKAGDARIINISSEMGALHSMGGGHLAYRTSKTALNALTRNVAAELAGTHIKINSMCPGWVRSDMGGKAAHRSLRQGADTALWLATAPNTGTGKFYSDRREVKW